MDNPTPQGHNSIFMTILTIVLYVISKITLSDAAAFAAIIAAISTAWLNIYRYRVEKRREKQNNWGKNKTP